MKQRRLQDLYIVGREVTFNDSIDEEPVRVWIQKMNATEAETTTRRSGAARSRVLVAGRDRSSDVWLDTFNGVADFGRDVLLDICLAEEYGRIQQENQAEIAAEKEWSEKDYLQGLRDSWFGDGDGKSLKHVYELGDEDDPEYEEAVRVFAELQRFEEQVRDRVDSEREALRKENDGKEIEWLQDRAVDRSISIRADQAFIQEFHRSQIYFGTRELDDHKKRYFDSREDVDNLSAQLIDELVNNFTSLTVEVTEGKVSPPTPDSLPLSEQPGAEETADSSGLVVVSQ